MVWKGGLGIWGAVAGGAVGALFAARQLGMPLTVVADALAPGLPLAQAVGRLGNWFNNELYGRQTTLPWGLQVHEMDSRRPGPPWSTASRCCDPASTSPPSSTSWSGTSGGRRWSSLLDRKFKFGKGRAFAIYVMGYTLGRFFIEMLRDDTATHIVGVRINVWVAALVFIGALIYFLRVKRPPGVPDPGRRRRRRSRPRAGRHLHGRRLREAGRGRHPERYRVVTEEQFRGLPGDRRRPRHGRGRHRHGGADAETDESPMPPAPTARMMMGATATPRPPARAAAPTTADPTDHPERRCRCVRPLWWAPASAVWRRPARWPAPAGRSRCWSGPTGSGPSRTALVLWPNGIRALRALGLGDGLDAIGTPLPRRRRPPARRPLARAAAAVAADRAPVVVHREDLHDALIAGLGDRVDIRTGVDGATTCASAAPSARP